MSEPLTVIRQPEPRAITRLVYGHAIRVAASEGERRDLEAALQWYELRWRVEDEMRRQRQQGQAAGGNGGNPADAPPAEPRKFSAVEQHGIDSPEAQAMREARRAARAAAAAKKAGGAPTMTDAEQVNVGGDAGTDGGDG